MLKLLPNTSFNSEIIATIDGASLNDIALMGVELYFVIQQNGYRKHSERNPLYNKPLYSLYRRISNTGNSSYERIS